MYTGKISLFLPVSLSIWWWPVYRWDMGLAGPCTLLAQSTLSFRMRSWQNKLLSQQRFNTSRSAITLLKIIKTTQFISCCLYNYSSCVPSAQKMFNTKESQGQRVESWEGPRPLDCTTTTAWQDANLTCFLFFFPFSLLISLSSCLVLSK